MPKRQDLKKLLILGSGPIQIGQACEFDYSGTQACRALRKEGYEVILVNSNPATIMTDPDIASKVYVEPLTVEFVEKIIEKEKPDALIPTLGGQTALNLSLELHAKGVLKKHNVEMLGATPDVIRRAEDREEFRAVLDSVGAKYPPSHLVTNFIQGIEAAQEIGFPIILRPNYTLGGGGGGVAYSLEEYKTLLNMALQESPTSQVLVEQSIIGWKEYELEVVRDRAGTFLVVCSIENFDPCGVHTGDSITVAPQQTLSDRQYQDMRDEARKVVNAVGIETGGANIQFAVHPKTGERVVIEMNPRVSRSSALASKATGYPIAKLAALLAVGYELSELKNDITGDTPACFEPAIDYIVTKIPRFAFDKFQSAKNILTTQMKSVGEVMGIGRTFKESLQKALASLEKKGETFIEVPFQREKLVYPNSEQIYQIAQAFREGYSVEEVASLTLINEWFLEQIAEIIEFENIITKSHSLTVDLFRNAKRMGFSDQALARLRKSDKKAIRHLRWQLGIHPCFHQVDTCAGEFRASTPYYYSSYWGEPVAAQKNPDAVVILGSGPNRIGQGIEFDYGCVRAVKAFQNEGKKVAMINSNPETVSTDYDIPNILFFEPLVSEYVIEIMRWLGPMGFVAQYGGQTTLHLVPHLVGEGYQLLGSSTSAIALAEDRQLFANVCRKLDLSIPASAMATDLRSAEEIIEKIGFPIICRPSYVIGGQRMEVLENSFDLKNYFQRNGGFVTPTSPLLIDEFLERALEVDVDLVRGETATGTWSIIGGIVEHIEAAGVHSGDSMGVMPPQRLNPNTMQRIEDLSQKLADGLGIIGHLNLQLAVKNDRIFVLEANPRCSRSVPFVAKASMVPLVDLGVAAILGKAKPQIHDWKKMNCVAVKGVVFPFKKFRDADALLGPEMKSTGESMGRASNYADALLKAYIGSYVKIPKSGSVFLTLRDKDKPALLDMAKQFLTMGFSLMATRGTADFLKQSGVECETVNKMWEGRPHCVDKIRSNEIALVINTVSGRQAVDESIAIRRSCIDYAIPCITESQAAEAYVIAVKKNLNREVEVSPL